VVEKTIVIVAITTVKTILNYWFNCGSLTPEPIISYHGQPNLHCNYCNAAFWYGERIGALRINPRITYNNCCRGGNVSIPPYKPWPKPLASLASFNGNTSLKRFMRNIKQYNCLLTFISMGAHIDNSLNDGCGPPIFKICGQFHHRIGSLLLAEDAPLKFIQLYIYDTTNEVKNRITCLSGDDTPDGSLEPSMVDGLMKMLD
jgi:hypothetical protein